MCIWEVWIKVGNLWSTCGTRFREDCLRQHEATIVSLMEVGIVSDYRVVNVLAPSYGFMGGEPQ